MSSNHWATAKAWITHESYMLDMSMNHWVLNKRKLHMSMNHWATAKAWITHGAYMFDMTMNHWATE